METAFHIMKHQGAAVRVPFATAHDTLSPILRSRGFTGEDASLSARLFVEASRDGVASHGLNRFAVYVDAIDRGEVDPAAIPELVQSSGGLERWEGNHGPGNLNAWHSMERATELATAHGIGCVALAHTNHWMRGGTYGWQAADAGFVGICWTNTIGNLPPWGAVECKLGNNPMVIAVPHSDGHLVIDFAQSQFSFGKLASYRKRGVPLPVVGGYDSSGAPTTDAQSIEESQRPLPIGLWKGAGLALMLDLTASMLSGGDSTLRISGRATEHDVSQVFIAIRPFGDDPQSEAWAHDLIEATIADLHQSTPAWKDAQIRYPGERVMQERAYAAEHGVQVDDDVWKGIEALAGYSR